MGGVFFFFLFLSLQVTSPKLPSPQSPLQLYSNQKSQDLKILFKTAIESTQKSLFLQMYGCTDTHILKELKKVSEKGIPISLFYDPSGSGALNKKLAFAIPLRCQGLMHKKILVIDHCQVFIGSCNFTPTSLRMHDNLVLGLYHKDLAWFIEHGSENHFLFSIEDQPAEFWHLPDLQNECLNRLLKAIDEASSSIHMALFTFTHPEIINSLIKAQKRGVNIHLAIDFYSSQGASRLSIEKLAEGDIVPKISNSGKLLHHKWAVIDESTLFLGSANWTKLAFKKNEDCIFVLQNLNQSQKNYFLDLWKEIERNSLQ